MQPIVKALQKAGYANTQYTPASDATDAEISIGPRHHLQVGTWITLWEEEYDTAGNLQAICEVWRTGRNAKAADVVAAVQKHVTLPGNPLCDRCGGAEHDGDICPCEY